MITDRKSAGIRRRVGVDSSGSSVFVQGLAGVNVFKFSHSLSKGVVAVNGLEALSATPTVARC